MKKTLLVFLILCSIYFWGYGRIPSSFFKLTNVVSLLILLYSFVQTFQNKDMMFKPFVNIFLIGIVLNIFSAYINNSQGIFDTFINYWPSYFILIYFFLHQHKFERKDIEKMIIVFAVLYIIFHLLQEAYYPRRIFRGAMYIDRGTVRMRIMGAGFFMLGYFYFVNQFLLERKPYQAVFAVLLLFILLKLGFRTMTAVGILLTGIIYLKLVKYSPTNYFLIILAVVVFIGFLNYEPTAKIIDGMINASKMQKQDEEMGKTYIRKISMNYFKNQYPENISYYIIGGGLPGGKGGYASKMYFLQEQFGIFYVDLGIRGYFYVNGLIALLGLLGFVIMAIFIKLPPNALYLNMYCAFILLVSWTTAEIYRNGIFGVEAIVLYLIDISRNEYKKQKELSKNYND